MSGDAEDNLSRIPNFNRFFLRMQWRAAFARGALAVGVAGMVGAVAVGGPLDALARGGVGRHREDNRLARRVGAGAIPFVDRAGELRRGGRGGEEEKESGYGEGGRFDGVVPLRGETDGPGRGDYLIKKVVAEAGASNAPMSMRSMTRGFPARSVAGASGSGAPWLRRGLVRAGRRSPPA